MPVGDDAGQRSRLSASEERVGRRSVADRCKFVAAQRQPVSQRQQQSVGQPQAAVRRRSARLLPVTAQWRPAGRRIQPAIRLAFDCNSTALRSCLRYDQGRLQGGSGRNLRPNWAQGGRELHPEGGRIHSVFLFTKSEILYSCRFETKMRQNAPNPISIFTPGLPPLRALPPDLRGGEGRKRAGRWKVEGGEGKGRGKFASLPLGDRRPWLQP